MGIQTRKVKSFTSYGLKETWPLSVLPWLWAATWGFLDDWGMSLIPESSYSWAHQETASSRKDLLIYLSWHGSARGFTQFSYLERGRQRLPQKSNSRVQISKCWFLLSMTFSTLFRFSEPQFPHLSNGTFLIKLRWELSHARCLEGLMNNKQ